MPPDSFRLIDLEQDTLIPVQELCQARLGKPMSPATIWRWTTKGTKGGRLEAIHVSGRWYSTTRAFAAFLLGQTQAHLAARSPQETPPIDERLAEAGLL